MSMKRSQKKTFWKSTFDLLAFKIKHVMYENQATMVTYSLNFGPASSGRILMDNLIWPIIKIWHGNQGIT